MTKNKHISTYYENKIKSVIKEVLYFIATEGAANMSALILEVGKI